MKYLPARNPCTAILLAGVLGCAAFAQAAGLTISPVVIEIGTPRKAVAVTITNGTDRPVTLQADTRRWLQLDGVDRYEPTDELLVVPPIAQVPPNGSQVFRIALRRAAPASVERTFRLILEDISEEQRPSGRAAVAFKFTHNLPVMVAPSTPVTNALRWSPCTGRQEGSGEAKQACVKVFNAGNRRVKVESLTLTGTGWQQDERLNAPANVLAGAFREWRVVLPAAQAAAVNGVRVQTAQGLTLQAQEATIQQAQHPASRQAEGAPSPPASRTF